MLLRRFAELTPVPWRNGGGVTREVMRVPAREDADDDFLARVSIADVDASGPFSRFDGVDRIIMLLDGPEMRLRLPTGTVDLHRDEPFAFDGAVPVYGEIESPTRDLNVMTRRGMASATIRVQHAGESRAAPGMCVVVGLGNGSMVAPSDFPDREISLGIWDCAVVEGPGSVVVHGHAAVVTIALDLVAPDATALDPTARHPARSWVREAGETGRMEELHESGSIVIRRSPGEVYDLVSDVTRMGEWSPVCTACWWDDGDGPRVGAGFTGHNETPERTWETHSVVEVADRGREFAFVVGPGVSRWGYTFEPVADGTLVTESWRFLEGGYPFFEGRYGDEAPAQIEIRRRNAIDGIAKTLAAIKGAAER